MTANTLLLEAHARDGRTVVERIRTTGLCRASRAFHEGSAARVVVSQLGPGMVRGDRFTTGGTVASGAHLIVVGQMATRVLSGPDPVVSVARWTVESGATLELLAEPTLVCSGAAYQARMELMLHPGARAIVADVVRRERGAALHFVTRASRDGRLICADALLFAKDDDDESAIGTLIAFGSGHPIALDDTTGTRADVRVGLGVLREGDALARVLGSSVQSVRARLLSVRQTLRN